jgi:hypothetical protein
MNEQPLVPSLIDKANHSAVSLRIFGDELEPNEITALLKCLPSKSYRKGDFIKNRDGVPNWNEHLGRYSMRKTGMWSLNAQPSEPADIEGQMRNLLAQLPADPEVWTNISQNLGFEIDFFCGFFLYRSNEGFELSADVLKELVIRHIKIGLDIYSPIEEELREQRAESSLRSPNLTSPPFSPMRPSSQ